MTLNLMTKKAFIPLALLMCVGMYLPAMNGLPIWDDLAFWFLEPSMASNFPYTDIWTKYNWPLSVSLQKFFFSIWGENYTIYHLMNLALHLVNSLLVLHVSKKLKFPHPKFIFLLFLVHPANVISVAWMIQFKTVLCFFLSILSFMTFDKGLGNKKWLGLSYLLFALSLISKSASIPLPLLFFIYAFKKFRFKTILIILPFMIMSAFATYRLMASPVTQETVAIIEAPAPSPVEVPIEEPKEVETVTEAVITVEEPIPDEELPVSSESSRFTRIAKSLNYYFWTTLIPLHNEPVKGQGDNKIHSLEILGFILILILFVASFKLELQWILLTGVTLILPYLGIVLAPYMNITWVSDQHLYLALPLFLTFWVTLLDKLPKVLPVIFLGLLALFFVYKSNEATAFYKDEVRFYEASLAYDPSNVPIAHNLAESLYAQGKNEEALNVLNALMEESKTAPQIEQSPFWPDIIELQNEINRIEEN